MTAELFSTDEPPPEPPPGAIVHHLGWHFEDLSDFRFEFVVSLKPVVLKNSRRIMFFPSRNNSGQRCSRCGQRHQVTSKPSKPAEAWMKEATRLWEMQWARRFKEPLPEDVYLNAAIRSYRQTKHRSDASNLYEAPQDALEAAGVLSDDYWITSHEGCRRRYDKENPRVEVVLTPGIL